MLRQLLLSFICLLSSVGLVSPARSVELIDLGTLGGIPAEAFDINDAGQVVGTSNNGAVMQAFLWERGVIRSLARNSEEICSAQGINKDGTVVGWFRDSSGSSRSRAFYWVNGIRMPIPMLPNGLSAEASAINAAGTIAGFSDLGGTTHAFTFDSSTSALLDLGAISNVSFAYDIADSGLVVGMTSFPYHAYSFAPLSDLGTLAAGNTSVAYGVNAHDQVVGSSDMLTAHGTRRRHAFLWNDGAMSDLGTGAFETADAFDINDAGWVVGSVDDTYAVLWRDGQLILLDQFIPDSSPWKSLTIARAINNNYEIVGTGVFKNEQRHAFLLRLDPPAPPSVAPVADAGIDQVVTVGTAASLDGSASVDPDNEYPLSYAWRIVTQPADSSATLDGSAGNAVGFTPDRAGRYEIQLTVIDAKGLVSAPDVVIVDTNNAAPIADAGTDQVQSVIGTTVYLDGGASIDPDGHAITYRWSFVGMPASSLARLDAADSASPTFILDEYGNYDLSLVVTDIHGAQSAPDKVSVRVDNVAPVAIVDGNQVLNVDQTAYVSGAGSYDSSGDALVFHWSLVSKPLNSGAELLDPFGADTSLVLDVAGDYVLSLVVSDGRLDSAPASVTIKAVTTMGELERRIRELIDWVETMDTGAWRHAKLKKAYVNKLMALLDHALAGDYVAARDKLLHDIIAKIDGCASFALPDKNDWLNTCAAQSTVYAQELAILEILNGLAGVPTEKSRQCKSHSKHGHGYGHQHKHGKLMEHRHHERDLHDKKHDRHRCAQRK